MELKNEDNVPEQVHIITSLILIVFVIIVIILLLYIFIAFIYFDGNPWWGPGLFLAFKIL